jgi:hypothetical protein
MKSILVPITSGYGVKNFLVTGLLQKLKDKGYQPVLLVSEEAKKDVEAEFEKKGLAVEAFSKPGGLARKLLLLRYLETYSFATNFSLNTETVKVKHDRFRKKQPIKYLVLRLLNWLVYTFSFSQKMVRLLDWTFLPKRWCQQLFEKYQPVLVLSTDMMTNFYELPVLERARTLKVPIIASILSWDNLVAYGPLPAKPEKVIVWNEIMKEEAEKWHGIKNEDIFVAGAPQYDFYFDVEKYCPSREEFFREIGADLNKKLITYTTGPQSISDTEDEILEILTTALTENKFKAPSQIMVRFHPRDDFSQYDKFKGRKDVILDRPGRYSQAFPDQWNPTNADVIHLAATLKYSDVIINIASTITIEAAIFDTPIVNVAFDGLTKKPYLESVQRYYEHYTHYLNILRTKGLKVAWSPEELVQCINRYLENPAEDAEGRKRIVAEQLIKLDGKATERVAEYIISFLENAA